MCGIFGVYRAPSLQGLATAIQSANDIAAHRGPDGAGIALFPAAGDRKPLVIKNGSLAPQTPLDPFQIALAHRRLAILDLSEAGVQPMSNAAGNLWITFNGEIYNYVELRAELEKEGVRFRSHTDTEVILAAYERWGEECVARFNGMWAFVILDQTRGWLFGSRDRFGIKPFHYYVGEETFAFSSEIKQLLRLPFIDARINEHTVHDFLARHAVEQSENTFFANIFSLLPRHNAIYDLRSGQLAIWPYFEPRYQINETLSYEDAGSEFRRLLTNSVRLQLRSDVEVGSCLSGGLDSSSLVCLMHRQLREQGKGHIQRTFSNHFDHPEANERTYMQSAINATGVKAAFICPTEDDFRTEMARLIWHQEEPFASTSIFAQWFVMKLAQQQGIKVLLDGQGADEQLAGYRGFWHSYFAELAGKHQVARLLHEERECRRLSGDSRYTALRTKLSGYWKKVLARFRQTTSGAGCLEASFVNRVRDGLPPAPGNHFDAREVLNNVLFQMTFATNLPGLLKYEDRSSMAHSVESRVPFLDHDLVDFNFSLASHHKMRDGYSKRVLRDGMAGVIPEEIRLRVNKLGFATPERAWRRTFLKPLVEDALRHDAMREYLNVGAAAEHFRALLGRDDVDFSPWCWINLSLWIKTFIEGKQPQVEPALRRAS